jgi:hypothetical protein
MYKDLRGIKKLQKKHGAKAYWFVPRNPEIGTKFNPRYDFGVIETNINVEAEKKQMAEQFKKEISELEKLFDPENVSIQWGVLSYAY